MGAHGFTEVVRGNRSMEHAYRDVVSNALAESGSDPYNGTISTTNGVVLATDKLLSEAQAMNFAQEYYDGTREVPGVEKWEAAGAIRLLKSTGVTEERSKKVALDTVEFAAYQQGNREVITSELRILKGYDLIDFRVTKTDPSAKVELKGTDGERETRYFIEGDGFGPYRWDAGHASQADARAFLQDWISKAEVPHYRANHSWGIYGVTRRADGAPLVRAKRLVKRAVLTVEYRMEKKPTRKTPDGWFFFGWAAS